MNQITHTATDIKVIEWHGLYNESWQGEIVPEAFSHPAKYSRGMIRQIYAHMIANGYIAPGDHIVDPFGGVGLGALDAMRHGLHWHGCELEPKFVELGNQNLGVWAARYSGWFANWGTAVLHQGDSRQLGDVVRRVSGCVSSPPYDATRIGGMDSMRRSNDAVGDYGSTPGQLGSMSSGDFDAAISSPPYADAVNGGEGPGARWDAAGHPGNPNKQSSQPTYGTTPGQLGAMDAAVSSPPYEGSFSGNQESSEKTRERMIEKGYAARSIAKVGDFGQSARLGYGDNPNNISNDTGDSFWAASREIVAQVYAILKPGGYAAWVTGDFVRKGNRVHFGQQWLALCTAVGFEPVEWIVAWKTEYKGSQLDIFGDTHHRNVDRVSFFRRLANEKNPSGSILNEDIIIVRKPL